MKIINIVFLLNLFFLNKNLSCCKKCCKYSEKKDFNNNNNEENNNKDKKKDREENDKKKDDIFEKCLNFKDNYFNFPKQYKPINSGFKWKNNNCWIISYIELYLNDPKNQEFLKNTNFDKNNIDVKKYIVLRDILKLFYNNEGNYNLDFTNYYEYFWNELERTKNTGKEGKKKYGFNDSFIVYKLLDDIEKTLCFDSGYYWNNKNLKDKINNLEKNNNEADLKTVNKLVYDIYLNNYFYTFLLQKIFGQKFKDYLEKNKDNLIEKQKNGDYNLSKYYNHLGYKLIISYQNENVENEVKKIKKKIENNNRDNISTDIEDELKNYKIDVNSILFHALNFHFFTFVHDINNNKWINLNSLKKEENGKNYNPIDLLDNELEITQQGDSNKYFPVFISITISNNNIDNNVF